MGDADEKGLFLHRPERRRQEAERRSSLERRQYTKEWSDDEHRLAPDRRQARDRRALIYGARHVSADPVETLENWLRENSAGRWAVLDDGVDDGRRAVFLVMFEHERDKAAFKRDVVDKG
jgi:hypothetical protein